MGFFKKSKPAERAIIERSARVRLLLGDSCYFESSGHKFPVVNVSETGLALEGNNKNVGERMSGALCLGQEVISIEVEVMRQSRSFFGVRLIQGGDDLRRALRRIFTDEFKAMEMSEVASSRLDSETEGQPHWFYAPGSFELYLVEIAGKVQKAEIAWNGKVLAVRIGERARAGNLQSEDREKVDHAKSNLIIWLDSVSDSDRLKALRLVENIPGLEPGFKAQLKEMFNT